MKRPLVAVVIGALVTACGPDAASVAVTPSGQERRVCEMYGDAGGSPESLAYWVKHFNEPAQVAEIEKNNASPYGTKYTPQSRAERQFAYGIKKNSEAKASVSMRLSISLREVNDALAKCSKADPIDPAPVPVPLQAAQSEKEKCEADAWDTARHAPTGKFAEATDRAEKQVERCRAETK